MAQGQPAKAIEDLQKLSQRFDKADYVPPAVFHQLALAQLANQQTNDAVATLTQVTRLHPHFANAVLLLAELNLQKRDFAPAIQSLTEWIQRQPVFMSTNQKQQLRAAYTMLISAYR